MTNKLFDCDCKTVFRSILDEASSWTGCFLLIKTVISLSKGVSYFDDGISLQVLINHSTTPCRRIVISAGLLTVN